MGGSMRLNVGGLAAEPSVRASALFAALVDQLAPALGVLLSLALVARLLLRVELLPALPAHEDERPGAAGGAGGARHPHHATSRRSSSQAMCSRIRCESWMVSPS